MSDKNVKSKKLKDSDIFPKNHLDLFDKDLAQHKEKLEKEKERNINKLNKCADSLSVEDLKTIFYVPYLT